MKINNLVKLILGFSFASWISALLNFATLPITTRYFEPEQLAQLNLFIITVTIFISIVSLGLDQGFIRFYNEMETEEKKKELITNCLFTGIALLLLIMIILIPFRNSVSILILDEKNTSIILYLTICILNLLFLRYISLIHRMENQVLLFTIISIISLPLLKISNIIAAFYNGKAYTAIQLMAALSLITLLIITLIYKKNFKFNKKQKFISKDILKFSIPLMPITLITLVNNNIPLFILRTLESMNHVGIYSIAVTLVGIITILQSGINTFWSPFVFKNYSSQESIPSIWKIQKVVIFVMVSFSIVIITLQDSIVLLLGENYRVLVNFLPLLLITPVCYTLGETTGIGIVLNKRKSYLNLLIYLITIIINIIFCYILIPLYSVLGAAMSTALSSIVMLILKTIFGQRYFKSVEKYRYILISMFLFIITGVLNIIFVNNFWMKTSVNLVTLVFLFIFFNIKDLLYKKS